VAPARATRRPRMDTGPEMASGAERDPAGQGEAQT
jgi:hypothetical protein